MSVFGMQHRYSLRNGNLSLKILFFIVLHSRRVLIVHVRCSKFLLYIVMPSMVFSVHDFKRRVFRRRCWTFDIVIYQQD